MPFQGPGPVHADRITAIHEGILDFVRLFLETEWPSEGDDPHQRAGRLCTDALYHGEEKSLISEGIGGAFG